MKQFCRPNLHSDEALRLGLKLHAAIEEVLQAEAFFNRAESHQVDYACELLSLAQEKLNIIVREAKLFEHYADLGEIQSSEEGISNISYDATGDNIYSATLKCLRHMRGGDQLSEESENIPFHLGFVRIPCRIRNTSTGTTRPCNRACEASSRLPDRE
jgi:hypothetical protein